MLPKHEREISDDLVDNLALPQRALELFALIKKFKCANAFKPFEPIQQLVALGILLVIWYGPMVISCSQSKDFLADRITECTSLGLPAVVGE